tara:strand:- start:1734 stop:2897 length:1164 start_codon:yes stop_codon:yes gene_type:complete
MILNVTHNITPNHMSTTFTGVRQSKILTPAITEMTTYLDLSLEELDDTESVLERSATRTPINFNVGIPPDNDPNGNFTYSQINNANLIDMGISNVSNGSVGELTVSLNNNLRGNLNSNSQTAMFMANAMTVSDNFSNSVEEWNDPTNGSGKENYYALDNPYGNTSLADAYKYRKRGFIPIIGKNQYERFSKDNNIPLNTLTGNTISVDLAVKISKWKWFNFPFSSNNQNGVEIVQEEKDIKTLQKRINQTTVYTTIQIKDFESLIVKKQEKIDKLMAQDNPMLMSEKNYPPAVWGDGGYAQHYIETLELTGGGDGKFTAAGMGKYTIVLNALANDKGNTLLGESPGSTTPNLNNGNLYKSEGNIAQNTISSPNANTAIPGPSLMGNV